MKRLTLIKLKVDVNIFYKLFDDMQTDRVKGRSLNNVFLDGVVLKVFVFPELEISSQQIVLVVFHGLSGSDLHPLTRSRGRSQPTKVVIRKSLRDSTKVVRT